VALAALTTREMTRDHDPNAPPSWHSGATSAQSRYWSARARLRCLQFANRLADIVGAPKRRLAHLIASARFGRAFDVQPRSDLRHLGSSYGDYVVPTALLNASSICYSAGIGEDASFDMELIRLTGCTVYAFDPTPRGVEYASSIAGSEQRFRFFQYGIWSSDTRLRFYAPRDEAHVSHSIGNLEGSDRYFEADCRSLESLMHELGHQRIDLLKLDVEGAEYEILSSIIERNLDVPTICVEFHILTSVAETLSCVRALARVGYVLVHSHDMNATLVRA
jgi:FkbM family methyltransferase